MLSRRQFLAGCFKACLAYTAFSFLPTYTVQASATIPVIILLYHRIGLSPDPLTITPQRFEEDLQYLKEIEYPIISLQQLNAFFNGADISQPPPVFITFDDGYADNYTTAFPLLQKYGMTASFFPITAMVGQENRMNFPQIKEMCRHGMTFGSHTVSHRKLTALSCDEISRELSWSKNELEQNLGTPMQIISYPCGSYDENILHLAEETGYTMGLTTNRGVASDRNLSMSRIAIFHDSSPLADILSAI